MMGMFRQIFALLAIGLLFVAGAARAEQLKPFVLAYTTQGDMAKVVDEVKGKLTGAGFEIAGAYSPYDNATVIAVTNDELRQAAAKSEFGGYAAAQRVSVTKVKDQVQVAYTNPVYMANAYRMNADLQPVADRLAKALGQEKTFGSEDGMSPDDLRGYHYMFGMEYFTDPSELAEYDSYDDAVKAVEANLAKGVAGVTKVYRVDVPGKDETVFGVAMKSPSDKEKYMDDRYIMSEIDFKPIRSTAHLPYEMLVSGKKVYALYARFRIAIDFPDLSMMGSHSFMNIMDSPAAIEKALILAAGGKLTAEHWDN
jgi:hypothetical protein